MKRRITILALFLLLGAVVNVCVAWILALRMTGDGFRSLAHELRYELAGAQESWWVVVDRAEALGCVQQDISAVVGPTSKVDRDGESVVLPAIRLKSSEVPAKLIPVMNADWSRLGIVVNDRRALLETETAAGWPMLAMWGCLREFDLETMRYQSPPMGTIYIGKTILTRNGIDGPNVYLPATPIWTGFLVNAVFYGFASWLLANAVLHWRRRHRTSRGLCRFCAYPIGTSEVCTECGKPVTR